MKPDREPLDEAALRAALAELEGWELGERHLERTFRFPDFVRAFAFMAACALEAEKLDHHPEWFNVYGKVRVQLRTHDTDSISGLDVALARRMNELAG